MRFWLNDRSLTDVPTVNTPEQIASPDSTKASMKVEHEVRFAVVMYGGVSLAIYINGVAQELLSMVQATAPNGSDPGKPLIDDDELSGAQHVYRDLGRRLVGGTLHADTRDQTNPESRPPIRTRFIVDVISGTSAGGINGVFLAKALAQNQTMNGLKQLWLKEGDLSLLLNDRGSVTDLAQTGFTLQAPQQSLLNSQRMYRKLLQALADMDASAKPTSVYISTSPPVESPLVTELDLFTTTTDIVGIPLPIALSDRLVFERRYKNVFHFRYTATAEGLSGRNDFGAQNDPFLAFAARCTSSFPFAFEPMCLKDIVDITQKYPRYAGAVDHISKWDGFFSEYLRFGLFDLDRDARGEKPTGELPDGKGADWREKAIERLRGSFLSRAFGDGGYLDNKPFSYTTSTLMRRVGDSVVERKLLYVEPSPDHPELLCSDPEPPDFAENVRAAVLDLPRQETIREDIDRLYDRNRVIKRLIDFAKEVDTDIEQDEVSPKNAKEFRDAGVAEMVKLYGTSYGAYHRLKVGEITGFLAEVVTRAKEHDPDSDAGIAIRELVAAWRRANYSPQSGGALPTENEFLYRFDIHYRFRRIVFLNRRANELLHLDPMRSRPEKDQAKYLLRMALVHAPKAQGLEAAADEKTPKIKLNPEILVEVENWLNGENTPAPSIQIWLDSFCNELERIRKDVLRPALKQLRATEGALLRLQPYPNSQHLFEKSLTKLWQWFGNIKVPWKDLREVLNAIGTERTNAAKKIYDDNEQSLRSTADQIQTILEQRKAKVTERIGPNAPFPPSTPELLKRFGVEPDEKEKYAREGTLAARLCIRYYNNNFVRYDMVIYPVEYGTGAGEASEVAVFRVSPEDAQSLMEERGDRPREKLAGRTLMSFGAFLEATWRQNDILWGRLDGAERLISTVLPGATPDEDRQELIRRAHFGICVEEIKDGNGDAVCRLLSHAWAHAQPGSAAEKNVLKLRDAILAGCELKAKQRELLLTKQELDRQLTPEKALNYISRGTAITGTMLDGLADQYHSQPGKHVAGFIAAAGTTLWKLIAVAIPQTLGSLFFRHWIGLLYAFAVLMVVFGLFVGGGMQTAGWSTLGIVVGLHLIVATLRDVISRDNKLFRILALLAGLLLLALLALGCIWTAGYFKIGTLTGRILLGAMPVALIGILVGSTAMLLRKKKKISGTTNPQTRKSTATAQKDQHE